MRASPALAVAAALVLAALAAGCSAPKPQPTATGATTAPATGSGSATDAPAAAWAWWGYGLRQCERPMWADDDATGSEAERRAAYVRMATAHYEGLGADVTQGRVTRDGSVYPAVCGAPDGQRVHLNVTGDAAALARDGWTRDVAQWYRFTFTQCRQPVWSAGPPTSGNAQDAWVEQAREHYEAKGVAVVDAKSSFTEDPSPPECGRPSNFRVHLQLAPAEDPALLLADEWEADRGAA